MTQDFGVTATSLTAKTGFKRDLFSAFPNDSGDIQVRKHMRIHE